MLGVCIERDVCGVAVCSVGLDDVHCAVVVARVLWYVVVVVLLCVVRDARVWCVWCVWCVRVVSVLRVCTWCCVLKRTCKNTLS